jgi:hypothetical protein
LVWSAGKETKMGADGKKYVVLWFGNAGALQWTWSHEFADELESGWLREYQRRGILKGVFDDPEEANIELQLWWWRGTRERRERVHPTRGFGWMNKQ